MASLTDILFGTDAEANITTESTITPEQQEALNQLLQLLGEDVVNADTSGTLSETQQGAQDEITSLIDSGLISGSGTALQNIINADPQSIDDVFTSTVADPLTRQFREDILPQISRNFAGQFFGSDRQNADARATEDLIQSLTSARSDFAFNSQEAQRNRALQALGLVPGVTSAATEFGQGADLSELQRRRQEEERLRLIELLLGGAATPTQETIGVATPGTAGAVQGFLSGVGEGAGSGAAAALGFGG